MYQGTWYQHYIILVNDMMKLPVVPGTYFAYQVPVHRASNTWCGSSMAGEILQDRDTSADLEQVSKFNCFNQSEYVLWRGNLPWSLFGQRIIQQNIPTQDSKSTRTFLHVLIPIPIFWRLLQKPIGSTFWKRIDLHLPVRGFMKNEIDSTSLSRAMTVTKHMQSGGRNCES